MLLSAIQEIIGTLAEEGDGVRGHCIPSHVHHTAKADDNIVPAKKKDI